MDSFNFKNRIFEKKFSEQGGQRQNVTSLAPQRLINHCNSLSLTNLRISRIQCSGALSCNKMKSSLLACSHGNRQSLIICRYEVFVTVFPSKKNGA